MLSNMCGEHTLTGIVKGGYASPIKNRIEHASLAKELDAMHRQTIKRMKARVESI